jgi:GNAT superfamily N-acetyltransferase
LSKKNSSNPFSKFKKGKKGEGPRNPRTTMVTSSGSGSSTSSPASYVVVPARGSGDIAAASDLITQYAAWLDLDLTFQNYAEELAGLPGKYAPPEGEMFLAKAGGPDGKAVGIIAVRPLPLPGLPDKCCEMKRLYISPTARGAGLGKVLVKRAIQAARELGYKHARLDTLARMEPARRTYMGEGFVECEKYYDNPLEGVVYMAKEL